MEPTSTDKRIDDLGDRSGRFEADVKNRFDKVDREFDKVDRRFERFEDKVDARFDKVDARFDKLDARFDKIDARFDRWGKVVSSGALAIVAAVVLKILGIA